MLWVQESYINKTEGYRFGDSDVYETWADDGQLGDLYRELRREYGRCVSSIYVDHTDTDAAPKRVGWVFEKRMQYEDSADWCVREVWVTVYEAETVTVQEPREVHKVKVLS